jgi:CPA2 family monovalent cation:H+ antiporter-2
MVLSESDYSHQALSDVIPIRDIFGLLFFVSVGILFDPAFLINNIGMVVMTVVLVFIGKALIFGGIAATFGYRNAAPLIIGLGLFQVGEFSFVLARVGLQEKVISEDIYALVLTTALVTMVLTPLASRLALPIYGMWRHYLPREPVSTFNLPAEELHDHVIVAGYGRVGAAAAAVMRRVGLHFVIVELDQRTVERCKADGLPVIYGDATSEIILEAAGVKHARLLLLTLPDAVDALLVAQRVRQMNPDLNIIARAVHGEQLHDLQNLGVHEVVLPEFEAGLEMVRQVLVHYKVALSDIQRFSYEVHQELYAPLYEHVTSGPTIRLLQQIRQVKRALEIEWLPVPDESAAIGKTITEMAVRQRTGASIVAVQRDDDLIINPDAQYVVEKHDTLAILGTEEQREDLRTLITEQPAQWEHASVPEQ